MRNQIIAGLFTTAVLLLAAPVAAAEIDNISHSSRIEEIQGMIQRSRERQGVVQTTQEAESESTPAPESAEKPTSDTLRPKIKVVPESTTVFEPSKPNTVFKNNTVFAPVNPATTPAPAKVTIPATVVPQRAQTQSQYNNPVPQSSQQIAVVRHIGVQRHQREAADPEPTREQQMSHRGFLLFASDLAWNRVDESSDKSIRNPYSLGARLEMGVITPLAAIRVYAPEKLPEALAILAGEKEYT